jgi:hypothetical protein
LALEDALGFKVHLARFGSLGRSARRSLWRFGVVGACRGHGCTLLCSSLFGEGGSLSLAKAVNQALVRLEIVASRPRCRRRERFRFQCLRGKVERRPSDSSALNRPSATQIEAVRKTNVLSLGKTGLVMHSSLLHSWQPAGTVHLGNGSITEALQHSPRQLPKQTTRRVNNNKTLQ